MHAEEIDAAFYEKPYFVLPENASQAEAFSVVRKALEETKATGLGKIALGGREHMIAVRAPGDARLKGMMAYTLRFSEELRNAAEYLGEVKDHQVDHDQLALAKELIQRKSAAFKPDKFKDHYEAALRELVEAKLKHVTLPREQKREAHGKVINLMDALRRSVDGGNEKKKPVARADGASAKHGLRVVRSGSRDKRRKSA